MLRIAGPVGGSALPNACGGGPLPSPNGRGRERRSQVGSGDRSERIRTSHFPQGRVTDHRINLTLYKLDRMIEGDLDEMLDALISDYQAGQLAQLGENQ